VRCVRISTDSQGGPPDRGKAAARLRLSADATASESSDAATIALTYPTPLRELQVADVMHRGVLTCPREAPLTDVAELMARHRVHCVVVADEEAAGLWGIVSDLDLVAAGLVRELGEQTAGGSAASPVLTISADETVERAAQLMTENAAAHLVVVERSQPVGVLSTLDIAAALADAARVSVHAVSE
jgi:CBS domain-containing protein